MTRRLVQSSRLWSVALVALLAFECVVCWVQAAMLHHHWLSVIIADYAGVIDRDKVTVYSKDDAPGWMGSMQ